MGKRTFNGSMVSRKRGKSNQTRFTRSGKVQTTGKGKSWPYQRFYDPVYFDPFPYKMQCVMRYSDAVVLPAIVSAGDVSHHQFRANGIHDPDFTFIGHQPYGYDQWANIYTHYQVEESTITIRPVTVDDRIYGCNMVAGALEANWNANMEMKGSKFVHCYTDGSDPPTVMQTYRSKIFENKFQQAALFGSSPADPYFFDVFMQGRDSSATAGTFTLHVTITYKVKMWEPKLLGVS